MRIILFGANGQIGRSIYQVLDRKMPDAEIIAAVRKKHLHFEGCTGDRRHHSVVFDVFTGDFKTLGKADVIINCIGSITEKNKEAFEKVHPGVTQRLLASRAQLGHPRIIQLSVLGADKNAASLFLQSKAVADELLLAEENTIVIRPSIVCTSGTRMIGKLDLLKKTARLLLNRLPFPEEALNLEMQPLLAADLAELVWRCVEKLPAQKMITATGPETVSMRTLLELAIPGLVVLPLKQKIFDRLHWLSAGLFRSILSREESLLLRGKNTGDATLMEQLIGRKAQNTMPFWREALRPDPAQKKNQAIRKAYAFDIS